MLKKILGWILIPYVMSYKLVKSKCEYNGHFVGVCVSSVVFILWCCIIISNLSSDTSYTTTAKEETKDIVVTDTVIEKEVKITEEPTPTEKPVIEEEVIVEVEETGKLSLDACIEIVENAFEGIAEISYDDIYKIINVRPTDEAFMYACLAAKEGDPVCVEQWNDIVNSAVLMSEYLPIDTSIQYLNTYDEERVLLLVTNGRVMYDFINSEIIEE